MREFFSMGVVVSALELLQNGGEFILLGIWGILLAVCRRRVFRSVCREAALEGGEKGRMLRAMTLKFQKSYEVHVEISDRDTFVRKYICQEKRMRVSLPRWRYLPERLAGIILCVGAVEVALLDWLGYGQDLRGSRGTMALGSAAAVLGLSFLLEVDSLWEQTTFCCWTMYPTRCIPGRSMCMKHLRKRQMRRTPLPKESRDSAVKKRNWQMGRSMMRHRRLPKRMPQLFH